LDSPEPLPFPTTRDCLGQPTRSHRIMAILGRRLNAAMMAIMLAAAVGLAPISGSSSAAHAACTAGSDGCPIWLRLRPGSVGITVRERLTPKRSRYSYAFRARAGQKLTWAFSGPTVRTLLRYPTGSTNGPGLPDIIPLPSSGTYVFTISSNTMAEDIFGPFELTLRISFDTRPLNVTVGIDGEPPLSTASGGPVPLNIALR
jgi:hypothetical protein